MFATNQQVISGKEKLGKIKEKSVKILNSWK